MRYHPQDNAQNSQSKLNFLKISSMDSEDLSLKIYFFLSYVIRIES